MSLFFTVAFLVLFILVAMSLIYDIRHSHKLKYIEKKIEESQGEQKVLLKSFLDKIEKMDIYEDALMRAENEDVKDLFKTLIKDEERHLTVIKKALAKKL